jgi:glycyl-tRNA synthetase beta chain
MNRLLAFMLDRLRGMLRDAGHAPDVIEAVLAQRPTRIDLVPAKLAAVREFLRCPSRWRWRRPTSASATS